MSRRRTSNALKWSERMRNGGYQQGWFKWNTNGTIEIIRNSKEPPKLLHVVFVGDSKLQINTNP